MAHRMSVPNKRSYSAPLATRFAYLLVYGTRLTSSISVCQIMHSGVGDESARSWERVARGITKGRVVVVVKSKEVGA